ncbi:MAG: LysR family transcription regulator of molybdate metabolism protein [Burkholderiaceae bacterium]|nr:LysR family transcription regulator of molybdate metabolism protein [Burkholderiaceae bacterium]
MYKVSIEPHWRIAYGKNAAMDTALLLRLLSAIQTQGAILQAAKTVNLSYRHAWGMLRDAETIFGGALLKKQRGRGTRLTPLATTLLWADKRISARLSPTLESLSSELEIELSKSMMAERNSVRLIARHGFAVEELIRRLNSEGLPIELRYLSSTGAVAALARQECDLAGFRIPLGEFEAETIARYSPWLDPGKHCLIHLAVMNQGLLLAHGNPKGIHTLTDLTRHDIRFVNRQAGSGTRILLETLLTRAGIAKESINGFQTEEFTHSAIAAYIASGMANTGFGVETAARQFNLDFIPLVRERYFFAVEKEALRRAPLRNVLDILQSDDFRERVSHLVGYDATDTGRVLTLETAFQHHS